MMTSTSFASLALSMAICKAPLTAAFSSSWPNARHVSSSTKLNYRSLHHGPKVEPLSDMEKQGPAFTKMDKDKIHRYGPGDFAQYVDHHSSDLFDGGDSEMGLSGDGNVGLRKFGRDISPHLARTLAAKFDESAAAGAPISYTDELLQNNPSMDAVRAQQLENWATQNEISMANRYLDERSHDYQKNPIAEYEYGSIYEDKTTFTYSVEAGDNIDGIIALKAPIHGVSAHELMLKNPYMGYAKFRAAFDGDASNEWSVTPSDGFLKQNEATHFVVRYNPHRPGVSNAYLVIETEDFKSTWKVVGSTGEYEF